MHDDATLGLSEACRRRNPAQSVEAETTATALRHSLRSRSSQDLIMYALKMTRSLTAGLRCKEEIVGNAILG